MTPRRTVLALLALAALMMPACAEKADVASPGTPATGGGTTGDPGDGVTSTMAPSPTATPSFGGDQGSQLVVPKPGTTKPRPRPWQDVKPGADGRSVRIYFTSGVEPCSVLDHVKVTYLAERIILTLYEGSDSRAKTQICPDLGVFKAVDVRLDEPIGGRTFGDGSPT